MPISPRPEGEVVAANLYCRDHRHQLARLNRATALFAGGDSVDRAGSAYRAGAEYASGLISKKSYVLLASGSSQQPRHFPAPGNTVLIGSGWHRRKAIPDAG